jgi:hypothetical protein
MYTAYLITYILVIPFAIMSYCYTNIIKVVWKRSVDGSDRKNPPKIRFQFLKTKQERPLNPPISCVPKKLVSASKRNVIKMTLSVIIGFLVSEAPYFIIVLIRVYSNYAIQIRTLLDISEVMAMSHSALNPILYGIFSTKAARRMCGKICRCCAGHSRGGSPNDTVISEDDTCVTEFVTKDTPHPAVTPQSSSNVQQRPSWTESLANRVRTLVNRRSKNRRKAHVDSNMPLLIVGRIANGNGELQVQSQRNNCLSVPNCAQNDANDGKSVEYLSTL